MLSSIICIPEVLQFTVGLLEGEFAELCTPQLFLCGRVCAALTWWSVEATLTSNVRSSFFPLAGL